MARDLPGGTVTFLFTDVEGSTRLLHELGPDAYAEALMDHRRVLREAFARHGGVEVDTQGDAFFVAFPTAPGALRAASEARDALAGGRIRVRAGIHTGTPLMSDEGYVGADVHRAARIAACGHGGQILVSAATAALIGGHGLRDLGDHRLKDLSAPERIHQLGDDGFPPLRSLHQTNLPVPTTPFVGRDRELGEIVDLASRDGFRLLTLTGPGGTGKTRLGLQSAGALAGRYPDGVWWVPLASLRDAALVLDAIGQALGGDKAPAEQIGDRSLLLLLDNFEQVMAAAQDVAELLASCPGLSLLVTSREALRIGGEQEYAVPPMAAPESVELFLARARSVRPDFAPDAAVAGICQRLDHLPLALELAAARVKVLSPAQILARLEQRLSLLTGGARDLPERQRTLRGAIAWSHELLTASEQRLFARLAIFNGGCTLESAEAVAGADLDEVQSLVDKSLLRVREDRFWMLETIREYAIEQLEASGEAEQVRRRHAAHFLALAETAEPHVLEESAEWFERLEREHDNLRAALDHLESLGDHQSGLRLAGAVWRFWYLRSHLVEGRRRLEGLLEADPQPTAARARALNGAAVMAVQTGDAAATRLRALEARTLHARFGDRWGVAYAEFMLGHALAAEGDFAAARPRFEESARSFRATDSEHYELLARRNLAWMHYELGDRDQARAIHEENPGLARARSDHGLEATTLGALGEYALDDGRIDAAVSMLAESTRITTELGERLEAAVNIGRFARALAVRGHAREAAMLLACSDALHEQLGARSTWLDPSNEMTMAAIRARLDEAALGRALQEGRGMSADDAVRLALELLT